MTNASPSPTSKKARFLLLKQKDAISSPTYQIDFPKSYSELFEIARTKFKGKIIVRSLYNEYNSVITSIESLKSGSIIYVSSKNAEQNSPKSPSKTRTTRGLSVQVASNNEIIYGKSSATPNAQVSSCRERANTMNKTTPSPKTILKNTTTLNTHKSDKSSLSTNKQSPNISRKNTSSPRRKTNPSNKSTPISNASPKVTPSQSKTSQINTPKSSAAKNIDNSSKIPTNQNKESPVIPNKDNSPISPKPNSNSTEKSTPPTNCTPANTTPKNTTPTNTTPINTTPTNATPINTTPINTTPINTTPTNATPTSNPSSQIKTSPNKKPRASSLNKINSAHVESPTEKIPFQINQETTKKKISLSPSPSKAPTIPKPPPSPIRHEITFSDDDKIPKYSILDDSSLKQSQKQVPITKHSSQSGLNKRRSSRSSTYLQLDYINQTGSQDVLQTTSKTYYRLKNNIIQEDPLVTKTKTIPQPKSSASVPRLKSNPTTFSDDTNIDTKKFTSFTPNRSDGNKNSDNNNNNQNTEDDDAKLFKQIHLKDRKGRRSNTLFTKMKSIESAIDNFIYFSPRNVTLKPKQANIQSDGDDDENIYKTSHSKDKNKADDKEGLNKDDEKDTLDAFRDSEGSDLFSSSTEDEITFPNQGQNNNGIISLNPNSNKGPILSLNGQQNNTSSNIGGNINSDIKNSGTSISPVRFEMPISIKKNEGAPMSSPANLDDFMESDDDMLMFGSETESKDNTSPLKINSKDDNKNYSDEYSYDEYDEYDEYEIELNNFAETSPNNLVVKSKQVQSLNLPRPTMDLSVKISPSPSGKPPDIDPKNTLVYAKDAISHHRSQSRSSYSFQNQSKLDITAIIDGSLQSPIAIPPQEEQEENEYELDLLPRNRSNSVVTDNVSIASSRTRTSPRIPKKPDVVQFYTNGNNNNKESSVKDLNNNLTRARPRRNTGSHKSQTMKQTKFHSANLTSEATKFNSNLGSKSLSSANSISGSSSGARSRTSSMIHSQTSSRRNRMSSRSSVSSHYDRVILSLMDSLSTSHNVQSDEDLVFSLIDKAVGRHPQEALGLPIDVTPSKLLPIMENQQASAWIAHGCLLASLQSLPDVDSMIYCYDDMVDMSRDILRKHIFYNESRLVNKVGSLMGCNLRFNVAIIGPRNSGKSTLLRVLTDQLIADLVLSDLWRSSFVFIFNMQNFSFESRVNSKDIKEKESSQSDSQNKFDLNFEYEFDVRNFYLTMINITIQHLLWHYPQLLGITKQLARYFESIVSLNRKHPRRFPRSLLSYKPEIAHELQNVASILSTLWNTPTAFEDFLTAVLLIPKMIAKSFNFTSTFFIIDHYDIAHRYVEPSSSSPFKDASKGVWLTDIVNRAFTENSNFIIASKDNNSFFEGTFIQRNHIDLYSTTEIVKRPLSKINASISDVIFSIMVEGSDEPLLLSFDSCGGAPLYLFLWNKMNMAADNIIDFRIEDNYGALNEAAKLFLETLFVDENGSKVKYNIISVKRMKKKQKK